ncbi:glycosyltransferase [Leuconostoc citreum]|nr:glycosyltransferase [Leuconostoc citreum]
MKSKDKQVKLSIIVAIYNVENELPDLLTELKKIAGNSSVEILLMNDGSTDRTGQILSKFHYNNFQVLTYKNGGLSYIRNKGLESSCGEYVWFVDGDDIIKYKFVCEILKFIERQHPDFIQFYYHRFKKKDEINLARDPVSIDSYQWIKPSEWFSKLTNPREYQFENYAWAHIIRRSIYVDNNILFPMGRNYEDVATTYRLGNSTKKIVFLKSIGYYYRDREGSITNHYSEKNVRDLLQSINEFKLNKSLVFSETSKTNFIHRYLVGAYYMVTQIQNYDGEAIKWRIRSDLLNNNFTKLSPRFKIEYLVFRLNLYKLYLIYKSLIKKIIGKKSD